MAMAVPGSSWFAARTSRERMLIAVAAGMLLAILGYSWLWKPLHLSRQAAVAEIDRLEDAMARVRVAGVTAGSAAPTTRPPVPAATVVATTAPGFGLTIQRIEPDGARTSVVFESVSFEPLLHWLALLEADHGLRVVAVEMDRRPEPGIVSARVTLEE